MKHKPLDQDLIARLIDAENRLRAAGAAVSAGEISQKILAQTLAEITDDLRFAIAALATQSHELNAPAGPELAAFVATLLTPREHQVAQAVLAHGTTAKAAHALGISESTLSHHRSNIMQKLGVNSFSQIAQFIA